MRRLGNVTVHKVSLLEQGNEPAVQKALNSFSIMKKADVQTNNLLLELSKSFQEKADVIEKEMAK